MRFSGVSALAIWNNATRTLTSFGAGAMAAGVIVNTSLAGSATVDFRPSLNKVVLLSVAILTPAAGGATINISDGTNNAITTTIGASATGFIADSVGAQTATGAVGIRITNTTVNAATYWAASATLAQQMQIVFDHDLNPDGSILSTHFIETSDPAVQAMLTANKSSVTTQTSSGFSVMSKHPTYPGKTRWQVVLAEVVRLNDVTARGLLGV